MGRAAYCKGVQRGAFARPPPAKYGAAAVRNLVFRFDDSHSFLLALREADQELLLPAGETVNDGEWVLAIFEVGDAAATGGVARIDRLLDRHSVERRTIALGSVVVGHEGLCRRKRAKGNSARKDES